jgi:hypothetical protein
LIQPSESISYYTIAAAGVLCAVAGAMMMMTDDESLQQLSNVVDMGYIHRCCCGLSYPI